MAEFGFNRDLLPIVPDRLAQPAPTDRRNVQPVLPTTVMPPPVADVEAAADVGPLVDADMQIPAPIEPAEVQKASAKQDDHGQDKGAPQDSAPEVTPRKDHPSRPPQAEKTASTVAGSVAVQTAVVPQPKPVDAAPIRVERQEPALETPEEKPPSAPNNTVDQPTASPEEAHVPEAHDEVSVVAPEPVPAEVAPPTTTENNSEPHTYVDWREVGQEAKRRIAEGELAVTGLAKELEVSPSVVGAFTRGDRYVNPTIVSTILGRLGYEGTELAAAMEQYRLGENTDHFQMSLLEIANLLAPQGEDIFAAARSVPTISPEVDRDLADPEVPSPVVAAKHNLPMTAVHRARKQLVEGLRSRVQTISQHPGDAARAPIGQRDMDVKTRNQAKEILQTLPPGDMHVAASQLVALGLSMTQIKTLVIQHATERGVSREQLHGLPAAIVSSVVRHYMNTKQVSRQMLLKEGLQTASVEEILAGRFPFQPELVGKMLSGTGTPPHEVARIIAEYQSLFTNGTLPERPGYAAFLHGMPSRLARYGINPLEFMSRAQVRFYRLITSPLSTAQIQKVLGVNDTKLSHSAQQMVAELERRIQPFVRDQAPRG